MFGLGLEICWLPVRWIFCPRKYDQWTQGLSQDLETGCLKLAIVKSLGVQIFKGTTIYSEFNQKYV